MYDVGTTAEDYRIAEIAELVREVLDWELNMTYLEDKPPRPLYHVNFDRLSEVGFGAELGTPRWNRRHRRQTTGAAT